MMSAITSVLLPLAVLFALILAVLFFGRSSGNHPNTEYDERQLIERGRAYRLGFFAFLFYNVLCAILDACGVRWCAPAVSPMVGIFLGVAVFAVSAIRRDALRGIGSKPSGAIGLWVLIILVQTVCFVLDCLEGKVIENGVVTMSFVSLVNAAVFLLVLVVYLVHIRRAERSEEEA